MTHSWRLQVPLMDLQGMVDKHFCILPPSKRGHWPLGVVPATMLRSIRRPQPLGHCSECRALLVIWLLLISCQSNYRLLNAMPGLNILKAAQRLELRPSQVHGHHFSAVLPHNVAPTRANQTIVGLNA